MSIDYTKLMVDRIRELSAYKPGRTASDLKDEFGLDRVIVLSSNENPHGASPKVLKALSSLEGLDGVERYPSGDAGALKRVLAKKLAISTDMLTVGSGSSEILYFVLSAFVKDTEHIIAPTPSFSVYPIMAKSLGIGFKAVPLNEDYTFNLDNIVAAITNETRVIIIPNPNNPTGSYVAEGEFINFIKKVPSDVIILMDEAYVEYSDSGDMPDTISMLADYPNIIIARTFSKAYGLAGLRIGYGIADATCTDILNRVRQPYNTTSVAQAAATAAVKDDAWLKQTVTLNSAEKLFLYEELDKLGIKYFHTQANFMFINVLDGEKVYNGLLRHGVLVRFMSDLPAYLRVTIGSHEENIILVNALKTVMG